MADEDRISLLSDCLLLEIISRIKIKDKGKEEEERLMSTKEVIKTTTTISKRWQHLWTLLPTLVFIKEDVIDKNGGYRVSDLTNYFLFIDKTLTQCPTNMNLKKFKLQILDVEHPAMQVNSWLRYAITRNVQEIDLRITDMCRYQSCDDELFFNNSCLVSMKVWRCAFNPPNGAIGWDKLKFLCIDKGELDEDSIGKILSGSPCLETLELNNCYLAGRIPKSLFGNFGVLERLSCDIKAYERFSHGDELFLDDSCHIMSMKLSRCVFNPPNGTIGTDKLKFLCIGYGNLDEDSIGEILSGSPCLETLELNHCHFDGLIPMSLFGNFGVLERLSCDIKAYERFSHGDELFLDDSCHIMSMKLSRCVFNPPNGTIGTDKLKFLCIGNGNLDEDSIGKILSGSPCLETLELEECRGFRRIDVTSKSVKNLVLSGYHFMQSIDTIEINAPYILSLTIKNTLRYVEEILLLNVSSLVKADLDYNLKQFVGGHIDHYMEEELLLGLLASLDHVNEIALGEYNCLDALSRLEDKGFQFRKASYRRGRYPNSYRVFSLIQK